MDEHQIEQLYIYPVKSCKGIALESSLTTETGLEYDRQYMLAVEKDAGLEFITQRQYSRLSLVETSIDWDSKVILIRYGNDCLQFPCCLIETLPQVKVRIWKDVVLAKDASKFLRPSLKSFLGLDKELYLLYRQELRDVKRNAPTSEILHRDPKAAFVDYYPVHFLQQASLEDLNTRLEKPIGFERFRPNVVVSGGKAWEEDKWKLLEINNQKWHVACRNARCSVPDVDPESGEADAKATVYKTMQSFRRVDPGAKYQPCVGINVVHEVIGSKITIGDRITILETGDHVYIPSSKQ